MIFENNYTYAGTTAIIYNFELDYSNLHFYVNSNNKILLPSESTLSEIGIEYKKANESDWIQIKIAGESVINNLKNGTNTTIVNTMESNNYIITKPVAIYSTNFISPIRIVIKNLEQETTYNIRSYYILNTSNTKYIFNSCSDTTMKRNDIYYECTEVTGGTEEENNRLKTTINKACDIFNSMTAFSIDKSSGDSLGSKKGGCFTAKIVDLGGNFIAFDDMRFKYASTSVSTVIHEMAHNLMYPHVDETYNNETYNKIVKFMEFATHTENATWRWLGLHNYPIISSASYNGAYNYLVAAACYVVRSTI